MRSGIFRYFYNSPLSYDELTAFQNTVRRLSLGRNRDVAADMDDYDLQGAFLDGELRDDGHLTDRFKKPNHPTFSNESKYSNGNGGEWERRDDGRWSFTAGEDNHWSHRELFDYFRDIEPDAYLIYPPMIKNPERKETENALQNVLQPRDGEYHRILQREYKLR